MEAAQGTVRLWSTSVGQDPAELRRGADLVLDIEPAHGVDLPDGVVAWDALGFQERAQIDQVALDALAAWRKRFDGPLTLEGICWPFVWEYHLYELLNPILRHAFALRAALRAADAGAVELMDTDPKTSRLAQAVCAALGVAVRVAPDATPPAKASDPAVSQPWSRRARRRALTLATALGAPTVLRRGAIVFRPYWPLMGVLDHMLSKQSAQPAICLSYLPSGPRRQLRGALRGGWLGLPTPLDRLRGERVERTAVSAIEADPGLSVDGIELGAVVQPGLIALAHRRLAPDVAEAASTRRALRRGRVTKIVGSYDVEPTDRLITLLAREAGVPTLMVCHGAYLLPQPVVDLEYCTEVVLWSAALAPPITRWERPIHVVGYPLPHDPPPVRRASSLQRPRIAVLGQLGVPSSATVDQRITMRSYVTAIEAIANRFPAAKILLRPHPAEDRRTHEALIARFPEADLSIDGDTEIVELLRRVDLLIGGTSAATLQAALAGTSIAVLNLTDFDWPWPLGGETAIPVARSATELERVLERFQREGLLPGQGDALTALGADGSDTPRRITELILTGARARLSPPGCSPGWCSLPRSG